MPVTQTDFTQNVIAMKNAGVKILFLCPAARQNYASAMLKNLQQQNFHPQVILGRGQLQQRPGLGVGRTGRGRRRPVRSEHLALPRQDSARSPRWGCSTSGSKASPGFKTDLFTLYGWLSAELFAQALKNAGSDPSRGSLLQALSKITSFSGNNIIAPNDPAAKTVGNCYLLGQVINGQYQRLDDPPVDSSTNGYRCDYSYITPPAS